VAALVRRQRDRGMKQASRLLSLSVPDMLREANAHVEAGRRAEALAIYEHVLAIKPNDAPILFEAGSLAVHCGQAEHGVELLRRAVAHNRNIYEYQLELGVALAVLGRLDEAKAATECALRLRPHSVEALCNLGYIVTKQGNLIGAILAFRRALDIDPNSAIAHQNMAVALQRQGRISESITSLQAAITCDPNFAEPYAGLVKCFNLLPDSDFGLITETTRRWARLLKRPSGPRLWTNRAVPERKLRIGYVSADFRAHPIAWFMENVLRAHDRGAFEVTCYSNNPVNDTVTDRIAGIADRWRSVTALNNEALGTLVRNDEIDILIDLSGHTDGHRLGVFLAKPAPVQCTWLGYYATTGLPEIDYIIADRFVIPKEHEKFYVETPWRLPDSYLCFTPPDIPVEIGALPASRTSTLTFGTCNNMRKVNKRVVALWSALLKSAPAARLLMRCPALSFAEMRAELTRLFVENGINPERIALLPGAERAELLATYNAIDVALDPFPYGGGTTTVESLWMGVPVVSLRGDRFTGRVSESILTTVGLPELVASDESDYLAKALQLAQDLPRLAALRSSLRERVATSPICDAPKFTRNLEAAYREMWRRWCKTREIAA
jgi:predicted O-linked N-acetylglucosamine transferase (SPINDLY family)